MITSHSTYCGYFVRDYHISFRLVALSNPSVSTLCLKDQADFFFNGQVIWVARLSSNSKNRENLLFNNKKIVFIETRL